MELRRPDPTAPEAPMAAVPVTPATPGDLPVLSVRERMVDPMESSRIAIGDGIASDEAAEEIAKARGDTPRADPRLRALLDRFASDAASGQQVHLGVGDTVGALVRGYTEEAIRSFTVAGARCVTSDDAAILFSALRSPFVERSSWMAVRRGEVIASGIHAMGSVIDCGVPTDEEIDRIVSVSGLRPGDAFVFGHNHPSGDPTDSASDRHVYGKIARHVAGHGLRFAGVTTNGSRYLPWTNDGCPCSMLPYQGGSTSYEAVQFDRLYAVNSVEEAAQFCRRIQVDPQAVVAIGLGIKCQALSVSVHGVSEWREAIDQAERFGASSVLFASEDSRVASTLHRDLRSMPGVPVMDVVVVDAYEVTSFRRIHGSFSSPVVASAGGAPPSGIIDRVVR